jgi:putative transposase
MRTLAQDGAAAYRETFDLLFRREATTPNEIWQADHTPLDIRVKDENGRAVRPWLTVILDDYSRAVAGFRLSLLVPSAQQTAVTLRQAIWRKGDPHWQVCGIPGTFYTDHGSDFTSDHLEQVGADLGMVLVFSEVGRPRGRGKIERFFATVNQLFLSDQPGYTAPGTRSGQPVLTFRELDARLTAFILQDYHQRTHSDTGELPQARWNGNGFLPRLPESLEQLDLLLLTVATPRVVQQDGIHFQGLRYLDLTLAAYVGETVVIRYDPSDLAEIRIFYRNRFLCRAICQDIADQVISLKAIVAARTQRRKDVRHAITERIRLVNLLVAGPTPSSPAPESDPAVSRPGPRLKRYRTD